MARPCVPLSIAGALFGWLISPLTDARGPLGIILFTPPTWAIVGFLIGVLIERRNRRKQGSRPTADADTKIESA